MTPQPRTLSDPLELPCGAILANRVIKSAMSDSLGDGRGNPTENQIRLYERWVSGGVAASIVGEVQFSPRAAEKPGNLVLHAGSDSDLFSDLARRGSSDVTQLWLQLGHAGAMAYPPISSPAGPSALDMAGLTCAALTTQEVQALSARFAAAAKRAETLGFGGIQIHAAHGFLLSQFLSPLFNQRRDAYGGPITARMRLLLEVVDAIRDAVEPGFVVALKINSSDQLQGGLTEEDSLAVIAALDATGIDLIDISGGTYFPGAKAASDSAGSGPYFLDFATRARQHTSKPLMVTGGFKTHEQALNALRTGAADLVGLARALVLDPDLAMRWQSADHGPLDPTFPTFASPPEGGVTAWYTMRLTEIAEGLVSNATPDLAASIKDYNERDRQREAVWKTHFPAGV